MGAVAVDRYAIPMGGGNGGGGPPKGPTDNGGVLHTLKGGIQKVSLIGTNVVSHPESLQNLFKFIAYGTAVVELLAHKTDHVVRNNVKAALHGYSAMVDATRFVDGIHYFVSGGWKTDDKEGRHYKLAGKTMLLIGGSAGAAAFFLEKSAVELGNVAGALGRCKIFTTLTDIKLLRRIGTPCVGLGLALLAADAMSQIARGKDVTGSWFWLANSVSEVAFITFILAGGVNPFAMAIFGVTAATTGLAAHIYAAYPKS